MALSSRTVLGVDAGGTTCRAALCDEAGRVLARAHGDGLNPRSRSGSAPAQEVLADVLRDVLVAADAAPEAAVLAVAGAGPAGRAAAERVVTGAFARLAGPTPAWRLTTDAESAFAAGTCALHGVLVLAGTGSLVAAVGSGTTVDRVDGHGWLVGDHAGAVSIALAGLRAAACALDGTGPPTVLARTVPAALGVTTPPGAADPDDHHHPAPTAQQLVAAVDRLRPADLARAVAPAVTAAAQGGDIVSGRVVDAAAAFLVHGWEVLVARRPGLAAQPVVLAGSLLAGGPLETAVRRGLDRAATSYDATVAPGATATTARDTVAGALVLALREGLSG